MDAAALRLADLESRRICRFCLRTCSNDDGDDSGGNVTLTNIGSNSRLVSRIEFALSLEVSAQDGLPQRICNGCGWLLEKFFTFKDQCVRAEVLLKKFAESGVPLMQYFEPVNLEDFSWKKKARERVDVGVQTAEELNLQQPVYEMIAPGAIKQEIEEQEYNYPDVPVVELNASYSEHVTIDEIARRFYGTDGTMPDLRDVAGLVTKMEIESPQLKIDTGDDNSNDTVEFAALKDSSITTAEEGVQPPKEDEKYANFSDVMLSLMVDGSDQPQDANELILESSPQSPSEIIYDDLQTTPLRESDGLPARFVDMEPGEILSDDEFDNPPVFVVSSDTEDNDSPKKSKSDENPAPVEQQPRIAVEHRCSKCERVFPQAQLLEAHQRAQHSGRKTSPGSSGVGKVSSHHQKMAIMIDNPTKRCPKCGTMVHKASYWAHIRSHSAGDRSLVNYDKDKEKGADALDDDFMWDE